VGNGKGDRVSDAVKVGRRAVEALIWDPEFILQDSKTMLLAKIKGSIVSTCLRLFAARCIFIK
jgi:hypothetical protein